jgi:hypothetical protein
MYNPFTAHPKSIGETYWQHLWHAGVFGILMLIGGVACLIHALLPFLFKQTASDYVFKMTESMVSRMPSSEERVKRLSSCIAQKA